MRIFLSLVWVGVVTFCGGAVGVQVARSKESHGGGLVTVTRELVVRQNHFFAGLGIGLAVSVVALVLFVLWRQHAGAKQAAGDE